MFTISALTPAMLLLNFAHAKQESGICEFFDPLECARSSLERHRAAHRRTDRLLAHALVAAQAVAPGEQESRIPGIDERAI